MAKTLKWKRTPNLGVEAGATVSIRVAKQAIQRVKLARRPRSSAPCATVPSPRTLTPVVSGVPRHLRGLMAINQVPHGFPQDRYCESVGETIGDDDLDFVTLENDRFRLVLCPGLGGRIISLVDRQAGGELLYQPPMILGRTIGMAGAWHVGGIELMTFRYAHSMQGQSRLRTTKVRLASGFDAVQFQGFDERAECSFTAVIAVLPDRVAMRVTLTNHSPSPQSGFYWTNIAVPANPWTHLFYPPGPIMNHGQARLGFTDNVWPNIEGFDCRRWLMHHQIISAYVYDPQGDWMANADLRTGNALAHRCLRADHNGRKLWSVGSGDQDRVWMDHAVGEPAMGSYVEIQSGRRAPQAHADLIPAHSSVSWTEEFVGVANVQTHGDSTREYHTFVQNVESTLDASLAIRDEVFWLVNDEGETLVEPDDRSRLSECMVLKNGSVSHEDVRAAAKNGWVAGASWMKALSETLAAGKGDLWTELALTVANSDFEARLDPRLVGLSRLNNAVGGWASYVRAVYAQGKQALLHLRRAAELVPRDRTIHIAFAQALLAAGQTDEAAKVARSSAMRGGEDARCVLAEIAFLAKDWDECRRQLEAPFLGQGEGQFRLWMMRKESDIAEALTIYRQTGDAERSLALLHEASRQRPQFGLSRDEASQSADVMFYRWAILVLEGRTESARLAANQLLHYPAALASNAESTSVGAYALRLAMLVGSPCAESRTKSFVSWGEDAANDPRPMLAAGPCQHGKGPWYEGGLDLAQVPAGSLDELRLRRCVLRAAGQRPRPFADLAKHRLFGHRASVEIWLQTKLLAALRKTKAYAVRNGPLNSRKKLVNHLAAVPQLVARMEAV